MDWEQKFAALQALLTFSGDAALHMRKPGNWYVSLPQVDLAVDGMLTSVGETGESPEDAVHATWETLTRAGAVLALRAMQPNRRNVKWNGFMWVDVELEKRP